MSQKTKAETHSFAKVTQCRKCVRFLDEIQLKTQNTWVEHYDHRRAWGERKDDRNEWKTRQGTSFLRMSTGTAICLAQHHTLASTKQHNTLLRSIPFGIKHRSGRMALDSTPQFPSNGTLRRNAFISSHSLLPMNDDWSGGWFDEQPTKKVRACFERALSHSL